MRTRTSVAEIADPSPRSIAIGPFGSSLKADMYEPSGIPVVRGQNIGTAPQIDEHDLVFVSQETADKFPACMLSEGDLVFPHRGAIGRVGIVGKQPMLLSSSMMKLRCDLSKVDPRFILYYFRGPGKDQLLMRASTVGTPGIGQPLASLRSIPLEIPSISQQQAIAEVLGALDDKIAANTKLSMISEDLAVSLLRDCPVSVPVGEIVTYKKGSVNVSALGAATVAHFSLPAFDSGRLPDLCDPNEIKSNKALVQTPSVLISKLNPRFPRVWDLPELPREPAVASTEFLVLEPKFSSTSVLWSILSQEQFKRELETQVAGTSGSHQRVKPADLLATKAIDPRDLTSETQHLITALCNISFQSRYENRQLATTRDALLPQLLSGKLRVKEAEKVVEDTI